MFEKYFQLKENNTNIGTEIAAGVTTFFAMSYIVFVNPQILSLTGMPSQAVFLATIISSAVGTLIMGIYAKVPYAQAPGMGLNAFFTYTVVFALGFSWQEALMMVFICGIVNIIITMTSIRKMIIHSIPETLQHAIGGGIGVFIAYIGLKNANFLEFTSEAKDIMVVNNDSFDAVNETYQGGLSTVVTGGGIIPDLTSFTSPAVLLALFGLIITVILLVANVKGAILIGIIATTLVGIPMGVTDLSGLANPANSIGAAFSDLGTTFGAAFSSEGLGSLLADPSRYALVFITVFAFTLTDIFDTIGTFIGTGRKTGIFTLDDEKAMDEGKGINTKMEKALFADAIATTAGAVFGTSNVTTFVESTAGIGAGGRTGLTSVTTGILFLLAAIFSPVIAVVPGAATAPALIVVGIMMMSAFGEINWNDLEEAVPAFFASIFMAFAYSISYGIAAGFVFYIITKVVRRKAKLIHPVIWVTAGLFVINFIVMAMLHV
ncbi:Xanthine/uracil/thiamine/ascorbate permease family protein [Marinilactibacillus psychrotolerans 42ea]|uniref:Xanthine/uracil/thiamine/ascorbate permease family protein n=1 Tax=Marinilactibacillus psychrotolerans 42ea TaxID=1255609 RepID=A0A1R4KJS9_9LACT|nr:NCS2 family permease [Marinilactibacillus psychrotolerans]SJN44548.1 Xanthine/uracil/thiamine/ascorbate permease family protein [Marinilactibacillus psychrotolerans 42ea]